MAKTENNTSVYVPAERWRGFNLLGKFTLEWSNEGFHEDDFRLLQEFGFNFARLPLDYRTYTERGNWNRFIEAELKEIDAAVAWGQKYGIHICLNLHRAPGYCVNPPQQPLPAAEKHSLWKDKKAQAAFINHWQMFARRYGDIPPENLSFNLVNEPDKVEKAVYIELMLRALVEIRKYNLRRLVVIDGLDYGRTPLTELVSYPIAQATHTYDPFIITHYQASWVPGAEAFPYPEWPLPADPFCTYLYGPDKKAYQSPLIIKGHFKTGTEVKIQVTQVSIASRLVIYADEKEIFTQTFKPGPGSGEWQQAVKTEWGYQNIYDQEYTVVLTEPASRLVITNTAGDWLTMAAITLTSGEQAIRLEPGFRDWGQKQTTLLLQPDGTVTAENGEKVNHFAIFDQWIAFKQKYPQFVIVGEWGVHNRTPHAVTLAFMEDLLKLYREHGFSWALWNFQGSFGIIDSGRTDVNYENYRNRKLDRRMLELLQKY